MAKLMLGGRLMEVVEGPAMVLEVRGQERKYPLEVDLSLAWVGEHMEQMVTVLVENGRVIDVA